MTANSEFDPTSIYNPAYKEKHFAGEHLNLEVRELQYITRHATGFSRQEGVVRLHLVDNKQLEEDLSQMYGSEDSDEFFLTPEQHKEVFALACKEVLEYCGKYIKPEILQKVFPNLDLSDKDSYDFSDANISCFFIAPKDMEGLLDDLSDESGKHTNSYTLAKVKHGEYKNSSREGLYADSNVGIGSKPVILVSEFEDSSKPLTIAKIAEESARLRRTVRHEVLHVLTRDAACYFPVSSSEGIIQSYALYSGPKSEHLEYPNTIYPEETEIVNAFIRLCLEDQVPWSTIDKAFLSGDPEALAELRNVATSTMSPEFAEKFFHTGLHGSEPLEDIEDSIWEQIKYLRKLRESSPK